ncbi:uncharacterized protein [Arachis hypogaea]|uniref:uncharacterized protein n=1 Tax=Arachis hypogaea TaxID=3818 RepID=UPI003B216372
MPINGIALTHEKGDESEAKGKGILSCGEEGRRELTAAVLCRATSVISQFSVLCQCHCAAAEPTVPRRQSPPTPTLLPHNLTLRFHKPTHTEHTHTRGGEEIGQREGERSRGAAEEAIAAPSSPFYHGRRRVSEEGGFGRARRAEGVHRGAYAAVLLVAAPPPLFTTRATIEPQSWRKHSATVGPLPSNLKEEGGRPVTPSRRDRESCDRAGGLTTATSRRSRRQCGLCRVCHRSDLRKRKCDQKSRQGAIATATSSWVPLKPSLLPPKTSLPSPENSTDDPPELLAADRAVARPVRNRSCSIFLIRIWAQKLRRAYLIVIVMLCIVLVMVYCTLAFILIYSVTGIGIVLDTACDIIYKYMYLYGCILYEFL